MRSGIPHALAAANLALGLSLQFDNRIAIGHSVFERKGAGTHAKRRAKRYARTRGHNKTQARRR